MLIEVAIWWSGAIARTSLARSKISVCRKAHAPPSTGPHRVDSLAHCSVRNSSAVRTGRLGAGSDHLFTKCAETHRVEGVSR